MASSAALNALKAIAKKGKVVAKVCENEVDDEVLDLTTDLAEPEAEETEEEETVAVAIKRPIPINVTVPEAEDEEEEDEDEEIEYEYYYEEEEEEEEEPDEVPAVAEQVHHTVSTSDIDSVIRLVQLIQKNGDTIVAALTAAK